WGVYFADAATGSGESGERPTDRQRRAVEAAAGARGLTAPVETLATTVALAGGRHGPLPINLISRTGFRDHLTGARAASQPDAAAGVWLTDGLAAEYGVRAGDRVTLAPGTDNLARNNPVRNAPPTPVSVPVAGVYTDLRAAPPDRYWCSLRGTWQGASGTEDRVAPTVLADAALLDRLGAAFGGLGSAYWTEYAVRSPDRMSIGAAQTLAATATRAGTRLRSRPDAGGYRTEFRTRLPNFVARAHLVRAGLLPPVVPITVTGVAVGLLVVAAATVFWAQRRGRELRVLAAHGVGAGGLGLKAGTEAVTALAVGAGTGGLGAWLLVGAVGPDARLSTEAVPAAALATAAAFAAALAVVVAVATAACRTLTDRRRPVRRLRAHHIPWELSLVAAGALAWRALSGDTELLDTGPDAVGSVAHVPARLLVVPILLIVGATAFAARLGLVAVRWRVRRTAGRPPAAGRPATLLAWRRLGREATAAAVLTGAIALPMALATYGVSVIGSVRDTTVAQARMVVGTDLVASLDRPVPVPPALAGRATPVVRMDQVLADGILCDMLAVDPASFGAAARWDRRIDAPDPAELVRQARGGRIAIGSGAAPTGTVALTWGARDVATMTLRHTPLLPGAQGYPLLLVDRADIAPDLLAVGAPQLWVAGDPDTARSALAAAHAPVRRYRVAADLYDGTVYEPITYTFTYLIALGVLTGLLTLVGLLLYLESRTVGHRRAYVVASRMGLTPASHRRALIIELAVPLATGLASGVAAAYGVVRLLGADFDADRLAPPDALVGLPTTAIGAVAAATAVVAVLGGLLTHRRVSRANPSEVLRDSA
ncbi:MAG: putative transport system permease protein, partial [Micromonosporaceae bacterium]|nr:putative transport system permease protein [Micromonosporaceae bacterium]